MGLHRLADFPYKCTNHEDSSKLYINCKYCKNTLRYGKNKTENYILHTFSVDHEHMLDDQLHETSESEAVIILYKELETFRDIVAEKLGTFENKINREQKEVFAGKMPDNFQELMKFTQKENSYVYYEPENFESENLSFPDTLMVITPQMKEFYYRFGRTIGFDFTFSLIKERPIPIEGRKPEYMIGVIAGLNGNRRLTIYAFVISNK